MFWVRKRNVSRDICNSFKGVYKLMFFYAPKTCLLKTLIMIFSFYFFFFGGGGYIFVYLPIILTTNNSKIKPLVISSSNLPDSTVLSNRKSLCPPYGSYNEYLWSSTDLINIHVNMTWQKIVAKQFAKTGAIYRTSSSSSSS